MRYLEGHTESRLIQKKLREKKSKKIHGDPILDFASSNITSSSDNIMFICEYSRRSLAADIVIGGTENGQHVPPLHSAYGIGGTINHDIIIYPRRLLSYVLGSTHIEGF